METFNPDIETFREHLIYQLGQLHDRVEKSQRREKGKAFIAGLVVGIVIMLLVL